MFCLSAANWWERSPNSSNSTNFCKVNSNGNANNNNASNTNGLAPFGYICFGRRSSGSEIKAMKNQKIQENNNRGESQNCAVVCTSEKTAAAGAPHTAPTINNVISFDKILQSGIACCKGTRWKASTQMFEVNVLRWAASLSRELQEDKYKSRGFNTFEISERGKRRKIQSVHISERTVQKSLCNNALKPALTPKMIYDNSATLKGKGTEFAIDRLKEHLHRHYRKHGLKGGILIIDFKGYFPSIPHDKLIKMLSAEIEDEKVMKLAAYFVNCFDGDRGLGLGSEISQISAIFYPTYKLDKHIKEQLHIKGYGRYNDDSYLIHEDIEQLKYCLQEIDNRCQELGITLNTKRVKLIKFKDRQVFTFLKKRFLLTASGKVVVRLSKKNIVNQRRRLRKYRKLLDAGEIKEESIIQSYDCWRSYAEKYNSEMTARNMDRTFKELFGKEMHREVIRRMEKRKRRRKNDG